MRWSAGWQAINSIRIGIFPGNRAPRGKAVVEAILSYSGKPVAVWKDGAWRQGWGWGGLTRVDAGAAGRRWASICDTPEQQLLVERYGRVGARNFTPGTNCRCFTLASARSACRCGWDGSGRSNLMRGNC